MHTGVPWDMYKNILRFNWLIVKKKAKQIKKYNYTCSFNSQIPKVFAIYRMYFRLFYPRVSPSASGRQRINMNKHDSMAIHILALTIIDKHVFAVSLFLYVRHCGIEICLWYSILKKVLNSIEPRYQW